MTGIGPNGRPLRNTVGGNRRRSGNIWQLVIDRDSRKLSPVKFIGPRKLASLADPVARGSDVRTTHRHFVGVLSQSRLLDMTGGINLFAERPRLRRYKYAGYSINN